MQTEAELMDAIQRQFAKNYTGYKNLPRDPYNLVGVKYLKNDGSMECPICFENDTKNDTKKDYVNVWPYFLQRMFN